MLLHVFIERHGLQHDLLVQLRCIQQVQPVLLPNCKTKMGDIQSWLIARNGDDIAVVYSLSQQRQCSGWPSWEYT